MGKKDKELGRFLTTPSEIHSSLGLAYGSLDLIGKRYVWHCYMKRAKIIFFEKQPFGLLMDDEDIKDRRNRDEIKDNRIFKSLKLLPLEMIMGYRFFVGRAIA